MDFLLLLIELFARCYCWGATSENPKVNYCTDFALRKKYDWKNLGLLQILFCQVQNMHEPATGGHRPLQSIVTITKHRCDGDVSRIIPAIVTNTAITKRFPITDTCQRSDDVYLNLSASRENTSRAPVCRTRLNIHTVDTLLLWQRATGDEVLR